MAAHVSTRKQSDSFLLVVRKISWFYKIVLIIIQQKPAFCEHVVFITAKLTEYSFGYTNHIKWVLWLKPLIASHPNKIQSIFQSSSPTPCLHLQIHLFFLFLILSPFQHIGPLDSSQTHQGSFSLALLHLLFLLF